jgi:hypothetical protein
MQELGAGMCWRLCMRAFVCIDDANNQGMEMRNAASTPSRWFSASFLDESSMFEFPEEERLQLGTKFLYPEFLRCLSAVADAAAPFVAEAQSTFFLESTAPLPTSAAFDNAEALLTQLVAIQVFQFDK